MVGRLFPSGSPYAAAAFAVYYSFINVGSFGSPTLGGWLAERYGYGAAFALAVLGEVVVVAALMLVAQIRDEAHRFAIGAHRQKRAKAFTGSTLDDVPGIGPGRKRALLMHFGTARAIRGASLEDLQKAPGVSAAATSAPR